jgi:hypothetical protein
MKKIKISRPTFSEMMERLKKQECTESCICHTCALPRNYHLRRPLSFSYQNSTTAIPVLTREHIPWLFKCFPEMFIFRVIVTEPTN